MNKAQCIKSITLRFGFDMGDIVFVKLDLDILIQNAANNYSREIRRVVIRTANRLQRAYRKKRSSLLGEKVRGLIDIG
jgi:hypothetical protein